jgi:hypothetical protein
LKFGYSFAKLGRPRHKVVFSREIDDKLSGIALGFVFVAIGLLLLLCPNYFGGEKVRSYFVWSFIIVGSIRLFVEADKRQDHPWVH